MSIRTTVKTVVLTSAAMAAAAAAAIGGYRLYGQPQLGLTELLVFACLLTATITPLFLFPLIRKTHLLDRAMAELDRLARTDMLTGVPNRRDFYERAGRLFRSRDPRNPVSILLIDVDRFKELNDTHGHAVGDAVLARVAARIYGTVSTLYPDALMGRIGGEEFAIVLIGPNSGCAAALAEVLCQTARSEPVTHQGESFAVTLSIGTSSAEENDDIDRALRRADAALYRAKDLGRDRWIKFEKAEQSSKSDDGQRAA